MVRRSSLHLSVGLAAAALLGGCGSWKPSGDPFIDWITPYRMDIQQGNVVTSEQLARIKVGMTKLQVRDALGTPLLADAFHGERWDYVFMLKVPRRPVQQRDVTLLFDGERLTEIQAPDLPTEQEFVSSVAKGPSPTLAKSLELGEEQLKALPAPPAGAAAAASQPLATPPPRSYPPLEPS